jgi:hypothetical protein
MILIVSADAGPAQGGECAVPLSRIAELRRKRNRPPGICEQGKFVYMDETHLSAARTQLISVSLEDGPQRHRAAVAGPAPSAPWAPQPLVGYDPCPSTGR